jgi:tetratricopeptide (TPR) repeat protein
VDAETAAVLREVDHAQLGRRLRDLRVSQGLTQREVAGTEVTIGYVSRIESGQRRPVARVLEMFAGRLGTTAEHLVTGAPSGHNEEIRLGLRYVELALETGEAADAERHLGQVEGLLAGARTPERWRVEVGYLRARVHEARGRYADAIAGLREIAFLEPSHPRSGASVIALSRCLRESGQLVRATETAQRGMEVLTRQGLAGSDEAIQLSVTLAAAYYERGDCAYAIQLCRDAVSAAESLGSPAAQAAAYWNASIMESESGNLTDAVVLANRALALLAGQRDQRNQARLRLELGTMLTRVTPPEPQEALSTLKRARKDLLASSASPTDLARCAASMARAHALDGQFDDARTLARSVLDQPDQIAVTERAAAQCVLGQVSAAAGDKDAARQHYSAAVSLLTGVGADRAAAQTWLELGSLFEAVGDFVGATNAYRSAAASAGLALPSALASVLT